MLLTVDTFLANYKPDIRDLALQVRHLVRSVLPDAQETVDNGYKTITYGTSRRMSEEICYIAPLTSSVNLGFSHGTKLPDPERLLKGTGKSLRHIKIESPAELSSPAIKSLLEAAKTNGQF